MTRKSRTSMPKRPRSIKPALLSSSRMTVFSPYLAGSVETRISSGFLLMLVTICPSWGMRFSAMSIPPVCRASAKSAIRFLRWKFRREYGCMSTI